MISLILDEVVLLLMFLVLIDFLMLAAISSCKLFCSNDRNVY